MKKILIVDDQKKIRELVEVTLRLEDYQIFQAKSGDEAIKLARAEKPDLVIMDVIDWPLAVIHPTGCHSLSFGGHSMVIQSLIGQ